MLLKDRAIRCVSTALSSLLSCHAATRFKMKKNDVQCYNLQRNVLSTSQFYINFSAMTHAISLSIFCFRKQDIVWMIQAINWPNTSRVKSMNRYQYISIVVTHIMVRRVYTPARWEDMEILFVPHASELSSVYGMVCNNLHLQAYIYLQDKHLRLFYHPM